MDCIIRGSAFDYNQFTGTGSAIIDRHCASNIEEFQGDGELIITTADDLGNKRILRSLGLACGSTVRARHVGSDILSGLRGVIGVEVKGYTRLLAESRE